MKKLTADSPEAKSLDLVGENIAKLKALFPELLTEGKDGAAVNVDVLKQLVGDATVTDTDEKYGLTWNGKRKARLEALKPSTGTLRPAKDDSVEWDSTQNLVIEGDNLEVLKLLQKSYANQVKLIYIDPPYNTGHDFIYPDNYQDNLTNYLEQLGVLGEQANPQTNGRFHTAWVNMIYPRLILARQLLRDDGVICISIGDNELKNLLSLLVELVGDENVLAVVPRVSKKTSNKGVHFAPSKDWLVVCCKQVESLPPFMDEVDDEYANRFKEKDARGQFATVGLYQAALDPRPNQRYWVKCPDGSFAIPPGNVLPERIEDASHVVPESAADRVWRWSYDSYLTKKDLLVFKETPRSPLLTPDRTPSKWNVYTKYYLEDRLKDGSRPRDFLEDVTNDKGTNDLKVLGMNDMFPFPKPVDLIKKLMTWIIDSDALCLDFFAGSGTTGQACYEMNKDGGTRRFILVQIPEPVEQPGFATIADLTKERLRRAAKKVKEESPAFHGDLGFRVFKLDTSNLKAWDPNTNTVREDLLSVAEHVKPDRSNDDLLYELLLKKGLDLSVPMEQKTIAGQVVHAIGGGVMLVCLADAIDTKAAEPLALGIAEWHKQLAPANDKETVVVFKDSAFDSNVAKSNLTEILKQRGLEKVNSI